MNPTKTRAKNDSRWPALQIFGFSWIQSYEMLIR